jgi:sugar phosphate isomerase/epimerase
MMKKRIRSTHIHDNDGKEDLHLYPKAGTIPWRRLMMRLRTLPEDCPLVLELKERPDLPNPLQEIRRTFDALEATRALEPEETE